MTYTTECVCTVGVQDCPEHPGRLRTKEEKIAFRKAWDARVEEGAVTLDNREPTPTRLMRV